MKLWPCVGMALDSYGHMKLWLGDDGSQNRTHRLVIEARAGEREALVPRVLIACALFIGARQL